MIEFNCSRCQSAISAQDQQAGQSVICPNCSATVTVPGPAAQGPAAAAPIAAPVAGQQPQIVVNIQQPAASPNMVHKKVNGLVVYLLFVFLNGSQYMYMG
jgi:DNA-directed RNA polymerase subunit RPC12/RpoP